MAPHSAVCKPRAHALAVVAAVALLMGTSSHVHVDAQATETDEHPSIVAKGNDLIITPGSGGNVYHTFGLLPLSLKK